jgi:glycine/D-amino acid oxidase-like deaminating enzyme
VTVYERTSVLRIARRVVETSTGRVRAPVVVRATEGFTPELAGHHRTLAPVYSLMIATEPLPEAVWAEVGWRGRETLTDGRHLIIYAQRTADGRVAFGGRGAPYHFGSRVRPAFDHDPSVFGALREALVDLFPVVADARVTHRWGGPLGAPRDWFPSVGFDPRSGLGWAGGYVGDGVACSALAGQTLAELICGLDTDRTRLPWVNHSSRRWEPEPVRWIGINAGRLAMRVADRREARTGRPSRLAAVADRLIGR